MRLYFLRHAHAEPGADDAARPLSPIGDKQCAKLARFLTRADIAFDAVYSSPLLRAVQTAERVLREMDRSPAVKVELVQSLLNESSGFAGWLQRIPKKEHVLLVGHEPSLAGHVRELLGIQGEEQFTFPKGGLACLETEDGREGKLKFFLSPKIL